MACSADAVYGRVRRLDGELDIRAVGAYGRANARFQGLWLGCFWIFVLGWAVAGQNAVRALRHGYAWSDPTYFAVMAAFWWFYAMVCGTFVVLFLRRAAAMRQQIAQQPGKPESSGAPTTLASRVAMVAGIYVAMFSALIFLAFKAHDWLASTILSGAMIVLAGSHLLYVRSRDALAGLRANDAAVCAGMGGRFWRC